MWADEFAAGSSGLVCTAGACCLQRRVETLITSAGEVLLVSSRYIDMTTRTGRQAAVAAVILWPRLELGDTVDSTAVTLTACVDSSRVQLSRAEHPVPSRLREDGRRLSELGLRAWVTSTASSGATVLLQGDVSPIISIEAVAASSLMIVARGLVPIHMRNLEGRRLTVSIRAISVSRT